jgi:putative redox protein
VSKPPTIADLTWQHDLVFEATSATQRMTLDGDSQLALSPIQTLAISLTGCMAVDVAHILTKGRHPFRAIRAHIVGDRAQDTPHRFLKVTLTFTVEGDLSSESVGRAIALSHDKYCSVWHSMRQDIAFTTAFEVQP